MKNIIKYVLCLSLVACIVVFSCLSASASSTGVGEEDPVWGNYLPLNSVYARLFNVDAGDNEIISVGFGEPSYDGMLLVGQGFVGGDVDYYVGTNIVNQSLVTGFGSYEELLRVYTTAAGYDFVNVPCLLSDVVSGFGVVNYLEYYSGDKPTDCIVSATIDCYLAGPDGFIPCQLLFDVNYFNDAGLPEFSPFFGAILNAPYVGVEGSVECVFTVDGELVEFIIDGSDERGGIVNLLAQVRDYITEGPVSEDYNLDLAYSQPCIIKDMSVEYGLSIFTTGYELTVTEADVGYDVVLPDLTVEQIQVNVFDWLLQGIAGVLGTPIFGEGSMTLGTLLLIGITLPLVFGVLKIFAGG